MSAPFFLTINLSAGLIGFFVGYVVIRQKAFDETARRRKAEQKLLETKGEAKKILAAAHEEAGRMQTYTVREIERLETQNNRLEGILVSKEQLFRKKEERNLQLKKNLAEGERELQEKRREIQMLASAAETQLLQKIGIQKEAFRHEVIQECEAVRRMDSENRLHHAEEWLKENAAKIAKAVLENAVYKYADESSVDRQEGIIEVPRDNLKEKIVGPGGRTLAYLEKIFDIDIVLNDGPNLISLSCFNLVTREIAMLTIQKLLHEKTVNETVVNRIHELAKRDMERLLLKGGGNIATRLNVKNLPQDLLKLIGRLNYRTSYGQNIMRHSLEVGYFARLLAAEIGADEHVAFLGGFFHDIGKAIDQEVGGSHDVLSKEILEKYKFPWEIVHAAWTHHDAIPQETVEAVLVKAADAISAGRPGARSISLEQYIQKIKELEELASSFEGVKKAYAISAGREVRIVADPEKISDEGTKFLASDIAGKIEEKGGYPGKIKVTTIRMTKTSSTAKQKSAKRQVSSAPPG